MSESFGLTGQVHKYGNFGQHGTFGGLLREIQIINLNNIGHGIGPCHVVWGRMLTLMSQRIYFWWRMSESFGFTGQVHKYGNLGRHGMFGGPLRKICTIWLNDIGHGFGPWHVVWGRMFTLMAQRIYFLWLMSESFGLTGLVHKYGNMGWHGKFGGPLRKIRPIQVNDIGHVFGPWHVVWSPMFTLTAQLINFWWGMSESFRLTGQVHKYGNLGWQGTLVGLYVKFVQYGTMILAMGLAHGM